MLERLSNAAGPSGSEGEVRALIKELAAPYGGEVHIDAMGSLYIHKKGSGPRVMVCAHMDEVAIMVRGVMENGLLAYEALNIDSRVAVSKRVLVGKDKLPGVIGAKAIHLQKKEERKKPIPHEELFIDIGAKDKADALKYVSVGDYVVFDTQFAEFGDGLVKGKALDDRVGCYVLLELLKREYECDLYAVFTVQEEAGLRGSAAAAYRVCPQVGLIFEGTTANDMPDAMGHEYVTKVGCGPAISVMDAGTIVQPKMVRALTGAAKEAGVPIQFRKGTRGATDAGSIHKAGAGAITGGISVPCRYIHSPVSVASRADIENTIKLADYFLKNKKYNEVL